MCSSLLHSQHCILQLSDPLSDPPLYLIRNRPILPINNTLVILEQLIQLLSCRSSIVRSIRSILLALFRRNFELVFGCAVQFLYLLYRFIDRLLCFWR